MESWVIPLTRQPGIGQDGVVEERSTNDEDANQRTYSSSQILHLCPHSVRPGVESRATAAICHVMWQNICSTH